MPIIIDPKKALERAQWLCSQSEKCVSDILLKFRQWGIGEDEGKKIINSLVKEGFIDESRYAMAFTREKVRFSKWGPKKIEMALKVKRIPDNLIQQALANIDLSASSDTLLDLISRKAKSVKYKDKYDFKSKLIRFGVSRGFGYGEVIDVVEKALANFDL
jgi:regulatory protein